MKLFANPCSTPLATAVARVTKTFPSLRDGRSSLKLLESHSVFCIFHYVEAQVSDPVGTGSAHWSSVLLATGRHCVCDQREYTPATRPSRWLITQQYGLPLLSFGGFCTPLLSKPGANVMAYASNLSTPASNATVKPNLDTLYATTCHDLSDQDLILTIPEVDSSRYYSVAFYSP